MITVTKMVNVIETYLTQYGSSPLEAAIALGRLPDYVQERVFETALAYLQEVAERKEFYHDSGSMSHYHDIARQMLGYK